jgi:hypothetical protein
MLNNDDRRAIEGLFERLRDVERKAAPRDPEAEALIRDRIARQPGSTYYMAQTVLVQEQALADLNARINELENGRGRYGRDLQQRDDARGPWDRQDRYDRGGGFLAGAMQTALGVTGGILLGSAIAGMFGAGSAQAAEQPTEPPADNNADAGNDGGGFDAGDGGGFDGGGFDFGGDF